MRKVWEPSLGRGQAVFHILLTFDILIFNSHTSFLFFNDKLIPIGKNPNHFPHESNTCSQHHYPFIKLAPHYTLLRVMTFSRRLLG